MESVKELKAKLAKAKRNVSRLERELVRAEKLEKEAQEIERARKIIALLEANAEKLVIISAFTDEYWTIRAKDVVIYQNANNCWCIKIIGIENQWELALKCIENIFVKAEI